jgi:hypothetical protein
MHADCTFADFQVDKVMYTASGAPVSLVNCSFINNTILPRNYGAGVIEAGAFESASTHTEVMLQGCSFQDTSPTTLPILVADNRGAVRRKAIFYSDASAPTVCTYEGTDGVVIDRPCIVSYPKPLTYAGDNFLTVDDEWLVQVQQVLFAPCMLLSFQALW